jgi:transcriptional regulator with XRE-family HTH domain
VITKRIKATEGDTATPETPAQIVLRYATEQGLSYREMAEQLGVSGQMVWNWATGHNEPSERYLINLLSTYNDKDWRFRMAADICLRSTKNWAPAIRQLAAQMGACD